MSDPYLRGAQAVWRTIYRGRRSLAAVAALTLACVFPLVALVALLGVGLLAVATHTISLPITDPED